MEISNGVKMLELKIEAFGGSQELNPTLIWDDGMAVLIDTGTPGQLEQIRTAMNNAGVPFEKLKAIILTHQDIDHIGSLPLSTPDMDTAFRSIARYLDFDIENVICYHGGLNKNNVKAQLKDIVEKS